MVISQSSVIQRKLIEVIPLVSRPHGRHAEACGLSIGSRVGGVDRGSQITIWRGGESGMDEHRWKRTLDLSASFPRASHAPEE